MVWHLLTLKASTARPSTWGVGAVTRDHPGTDSTGSNSVPWCYTWEPTAHHWDPMERKSTHQKTPVELPLSETIFQSSQKVSGGKLGHNPLAIPIQASAVELPPLEIKRMPCDTVQCACSSAVSHADFKRCTSSELNQDYFCSHKDPEWHWGADAVSQKLLCFPKELAQKVEANSL